jgi:hypothetical protein
MISQNGVDYEQILRLYRIAENKGEQILILAELTASDEETIIEVLKDHGVFNPEDIADSLRTCTGCGRKYIARDRRGRAVCPQCAFRRRKQRENEKKKKKREEKRRQEDGR